MVSVTLTPPLQAAGASEEHPPEGAARVDALDHALAAHTRAQNLMTSQGTEEADGYFSRFSEGHIARAMSIQSDKPGEEVSKNGGVQEQSNALHPHFVLAKPVRLL